MIKKPPLRILIIAGSDSGGGAGIQADIKTVTMLGGHAMTAITAVTAQNSRGVDAVYPIPTDIVMAQIEAVVDDFGIDAVKIGMIGSAETAHSVAGYLESLPPVPVVFDPVMIATSGAVLADEDTVAAFERLMHIARVTTPNVAELKALGGDEAMRERRIAYLAKGGDAGGNSVTDRLYMHPGQSASWNEKRIDTPHTHGTGCTLASAIAVGLAEGMTLQRATERARLFVRLSIYDAPGLGEGNGPMGQAFAGQDACGRDWQLNQITLPARDYSASVKFYLDLGFVQIVDSPENGYARFEAPNGVTLSIHGAGGDDAERADGTTIIYLESMRLTEWVAELAGKGLQFDQMPRSESWGWTEAHLRDPHGNIICLYYAGENRRYPAWRI